MSLTWSSFVAVGEGPFEMGESIESDVEDKRASSTSGKYQYVKT